jgi:chromate transporter
LLSAGSLPPGVDLFALMYRAGALVFGGGHVVLPLLEAQTVAAGRIGGDAFLAGYGAAQALPGPLFTFAGFLGAAQAPGPNGWAGGLIATAGIFLPSFLLVFGVLPFWARLRGSHGVRAALAGVNAAVVGLLLAVFYDPVWQSAIRDSADFALALAALCLLAVWRVPAWAVVAGAGVLAWLLG